MRSVFFSIAILVASVAASPASLAQQPHVRVRVLDTYAPQAVVLFAEQATTMMLDGVSMSVGAASAVYVAREGDGLQVEVDGRRQRAGLVEYGGAEHAWTLALRYPADPGIERRYQGRLRVQPDTDALRLINTVPLEPYVAAVLTKEFNFQEPSSSEAMAIVIRSYALKSVQNPVSDAFDLYDHTASQVYHGIGDTAPMARQATRNTAGNVVLHRGELIDAVYSASSGGHTANNEDVWQGAALPYLRGVSDPYDANSPHRDWSVTMPRGVFLQALSDQLGRPVQDVEIADRSDDGRVNRLRLTHLNGTESFLAASVFRQTLNRRLDAPGLRSTLFDLSGSDGMIVIEGQGYGHGVGLGQWGALEMGRQGKTAHEIIQFYYRGVRVEPVYEADVFADLDTSPSEASAPEAGERREALLNRLGW